MCDFTDRELDFKAFSKLIIFGDTPNLAGMFHSNSLGRGSKPAHSPLFLSIPRLSLKQGTGNRGMGTGNGNGNGEWERGMGMGNGNGEWERGMGTGNGNGEWERGMGTGNGNGDRMGTGNGSGSGNGNGSGNGRGNANGNHKKTSFKKTNKFFVCLHGEKNIIYTL